MYLNVMSALKEMELLFYCFLVSYVDETTSVVLNYEPDTFDD